MGLKCFGLSLGYRFGMLENHMQMEMGTAWYCKRSLVLKGFGRDNYQYLVQVWYKVLQAGFRMICVGRGFKISRQLQDGSCHAGGI